ncbi:MAG: LCP family protein [Candidatus Komeilibacteria bacterium]|nr:LCP family protein [Candidatus Komeilibacteria bacterium]
MPFTTENRSFSSAPFSSPNFLPDREPEPPRDPAAGKRWRIFSGCILIIIVLTWSCTKLVSRSNNNFFVGVKNGFFVRQLTHFLSGNRYDLKGEKDDRINFLLMGIGGPGHDGPYLTDTIILASYKPSTKEAAMISVPRDLIVPTGNGTYLKVNHVYALSQKDGLDKAFARTKQVIGATFGIPVHYMGVVDFQGFIKLIDTIGDIAVTVDRDFTDYQFPNNSSGVETVSFKKGDQKMDGVTALNFVRSRHGNNGEGSDFARSKRQQKILIATKEKLSSFNTLFNPRKITALFGLVNEYTKTDIEPWEVVRLIQMAKDTDANNITTLVFDDSPGGYLYSGISSIDGAYILQPVGGNYSQLQNLVQNRFSNRQLTSEHAVVVLQNGTAIPNRAAAGATTLERTGIKPIAVGNAKRTDYTTTQLYDYTNGGKALTRSFLESWLGVTAQTRIPLELLSYSVAKEMNALDQKGDPQPLDFLIILGQDVRDLSRSELIRTLTAEELKAATSTPTSTPDGTPLLITPLTE